MLGSLDSETKKLILVLIFAVISLYVIVPSINNYLRSTDFSGALKSDTNILEYITGDVIATPGSYEINKNLDYKMFINTSEGDINIDLFEGSAPKNISNLAYISKYYKDGSSIILKKDYLIEIKFPKKLGYTVEDEINFGSSNSGIKVREADFLSQLYNPRDSKTYVFKADNLRKYADFTIKEFYEEVLGYKYSEGSTSFAPTKYIVYMSNAGPNTNKGDFFILMADSAVELDGRFTPIGRVVGGFDVLDKINNQEAKNIQITNIKVEGS